MDAGYFKSLCEGFILLLPPQMTPMFTDIEVSSFFFSVGYFKNLMLSLYENRILSVLLIRFHLENSLENLDTCPVFEDSNDMIAGPL